MTHLSDDDLVRWQQGNDALNRDRIVSHLAACDECGARLAEIVRTDLPDAEPRVLSADRFVERGYRARKKTRRRAYWMLPMAAAAAAIVVFAVVLRPWNVELPLTIEGDEHAVRGNAIRTVVPVAVAMRPVRFEWISGLAAANYQVDVMDSDGHVVFSGQSSAERLELPSEAEERLVSGRSYSWRVTAFDRAGAVLTVSPTQSFEIAAAR